MKNIINLSLGSSRRDFEAEFLFANYKVKVKRRGFDGDTKALFKFALKLDNFDAAAIGGVNSAYNFDGQTWGLLQYKTFARKISIPLYDGDWIKKQYEPYRLSQIIQQNQELQTMKWLVFSVLDRDACYRLLREKNINTVIGDTYSALNIPIIFSHTNFKILAKIFLPIFSLLPTQSFYPHNLQRKSRESPAFLKNIDVILSETNFLLNKNLNNLKRKILILSRLSIKEREYFKMLGISKLYNLLPGEILSANIIEAIVGSTIGFNACKQQEMFALIDNLERR